MKVKKHRANVTSKREYKFSKYNSLSEIMELPMTDVFNGAVPACATLLIAGDNYANCHCKIKDFLPHLTVSSLSVLKNSPNFGSVSYRQVLDFISKFEIVLA